MIGATTKLAGIIGWPVSHSRSPRLHGTWLSRYGIDGAYVPLPVAPGQLAAALKGLVALGFRGANVTIPHKEEALKLADRATARALAIGAANTLIVQEDGTLLADNSDAPGFLAALKAGAPEFDPAARPAVVLGAGGAARAVIWALIDAGAPEVRLLNRTKARAEELAQAFGPRVNVMAWHGPEALSGAGLLVNTTSLGMTGQPPLTLDLAPLPGHALVYDIVYAPLETDLLAAARTRGLATVDGLAMLIGQAAVAFAHFFSAAPPRERDAELRELLTR